MAGAVTEATVPTVDFSPTWPAPAGLHLQPLLPRPTEDKGTGYPELRVMEIVGIADTSLAPRVLRRVAKLS